MKLKLFTLIVLSFFLLSNKGGRNQPSVAAPGDGPATCGQCHGGGNFEPDVTVQLKDSEDNIIEDYVPGTTYTMEIVGSVSMGQNPDGYGFQMVVLDTLSDEQAGEFLSYGDNVRNNVVKERNYVMQSAPRSDGTFTAEWKAPEENTGPVKVYVSILAINGNNNTNGDRVFTTDIMFEEGIVSSSQEYVSEQVTIYPNPTSGVVKIQGDYSEVRIFDISGRRVSFDNAAKNQIDISSLDQGVYLIQIDGAKSKRVIKL